MAVLGAASLVPILLAGVRVSGSGPCVVVDGAGRCLIEAADPARPGGPIGPAIAPRVPTRPASPARRANRVAAVVSEPLPDLAGLPTPGGGWAVRPVPIIPGPAPVKQPAVPAAVPEPALSVLLRQAVKQLNLSPPEIRTSAQGSAYVGVPLWLWIDQGQGNIGPVSATAAAGAARVTATARLTATRWRMGPVGAVVECVGTGTPWTGQTGPSPDCGYLYTERSLPSRTGGRGSWTVQVTGIWQVTWAGITGGAPVAGEQELDLTAPQELPVGELQALVTGSGR